MGFRPFGHTTVSVFGGGLVVQGFVVSVVVVLEAPVVGQELGFVESVEAF